MLRQIFKAVASVAIVVGLAACTSAGASAPPASIASPETSTMPDAGMSMDATVDVGALGAPADAANADRTIRMTASDQLAFDPAAVEVKAGETIKFEIENTGTTDHEFVLGSPEYQTEHEQEMASGAMDMHDEPNTIEIPTGTTASLTWKFTEAGTTSFACHEPGHFAGGMVGDITVTP